MRLKSNDAIHVAAAVDFGQLLAAPDELRWLATFDIAPAEAAQRHGLAFLPITSRQTMVPGSGVRPCTGEQQALVVRR